MYGNLQDLDRILSTTDDASLRHYFSTLPHNEFSSKYSGGYGDAYQLSTQSHPYAKNIGTQALLQQCAVPPNGVLLDAFGGSGQIASAMSRYLRERNSFDILTADVEIDQIKKAVAKGHPAIALDVSNMGIVKTGVFDSVLLGYGFHHLPPERRPRAIEEAIRVVKPRGRLVLHEGMRGGITQKLSHGIIDCHGTSPHLYEHPSYDEVRSYLPKGVHIEETNIFDPHVIVDTSDKAVEASFLSYYVGHYSLPRDLSYERLRDIICDIYNEHSFPEWETAPLFGGHSWAHGAEYERRFYLGRLPQPMKSALFPLGMVDLPATWAAIVPRFAKVFTVMVK